MAKPRSIPRKRSSDPVEAPRRQAAPVSPLSVYKAKRNFGATPEPRGRKAKADGFRFVVQKHDARRLHYDLRLELDGVLKSWAVTRGPSLVPGEKRLAVHTEDHPLDYLAFEGVIPKGEYGGGTMIVWDRGTWAPEGDPRTDYAKGRLTFALKGERLSGRWHLVRTRPRGGKEQWLLIKGDDAAARSSADPDILEEHQTSVLSGHTNDELAKGGRARDDHARRGAVAKAGRRTAPTRVDALQGVRKGILPPFVEPCLASLVDTPPSGDEWLHEIKFDGYRLQARIDGGSVRLLTRSGLDWTERFGVLAERIRHLAIPSALIDGELVVEDENGVSSFAGLQAELKAGRSERLVYYAFDLLYVNGRDLRGVPLRDRKRVLEALLDDLPADGSIRASQHLDADGASMVRHACRMGLEGIVSKRADAPYASGRGGDWLKAKCTERQEFVIAGFVPSTVARKAIGSLVLGLWENRTFRHVGRVGTGFTATTARELWQTLEPLRRDGSPFARLSREAAAGVRWVEPELVAEVELRGWTADGLVRHAAYKGVREDKKARAVKRESTPPKPSGSFGQRRPKVRLTHPDRVLWPDVGVTKEGLAAYYTEVADWVLPHVVDRPLSLVRCPDGTGAKCFFQKHAWAGLDEKLVRRVKVGDDEALAIRDLDGLLALVQAGVLEIHPWGAKARSPQTPDRITFDLDPGDRVPWSAMQNAAREVRERLRLIGHESFLKTTGGKGLHVVVPLKARASWDEVKAFAQRIASEMARDAPDRFTVNMAKAGRTGRIYVDYLRNGRGATAVAAYSTRARARAPVSTPLEWSELDTLVSGSFYTLANLPARLAHLAANPWAGIAEATRPLASGKPSRASRRIVATAR